jgi:hypothetical protein
MSKNISRRTWLNMLLASGLIASPLFADGDVASLRDTLRTGLKCRRDLEFEFVDKVVDLVYAGQLPNDLVLNTMRYAQSKRTDIPFPYFEAALRLRAEKLGVDL